MAHSYECNLNAILFNVVAEFGKQHFHPVYPVALYDDVAIFGGATYTTACFQHFAKFFQVVIGTYKAADKCYRFTAAIASFELYVQFLTFGRQCVDGGLGGGFVCKIGICGIDNV